MNQTEQIVFERLLTHLKEAQANLAKASRMARALGRVNDEKLLVGVNNELGDLRRELEPDHG